MLKNTKLILKFLTFAIILIACYTNSKAQSLASEGFQSPLDIPLFLSGNFAELRSTHFHAGIDLKTEGVIGKRVLAAYDGYVSRIKIQSGGYGRSIYITHPNGYTTVYGHLDHFIPEIQQYVVENQYARKSYEIELFPSKGRFAFKKGELVAYSGNTGRSGGPHLHFEVRKTAGQIPQNGLKLGFDIKDNLAPEFRSLYTYFYKQMEPNGIQVERTEYSLKKINNSLYEITDTLLVKGNYLGFGVEIYDFLDGSANKCGVYEMELIVDSEAVFSFRLDEVSFAKTRFINAHMDYELKKAMGKSVHRLFKLPNNPLPIYAFHRENGILPIKDAKYHQVSIIAKDVYGNTSRLNFGFQRESYSVFNYEVPKIGYIVEWDKGREISTSDMQVNIPPGALYEDANLYFEQIKNDQSFLADTFLLHEEYEPLQKNISVSVKLDSVDPKIQSKLLFASVNDDGNLSGAGGDYSSGAIKINTRDFGKYVLAIDTVAPEIIPLKFTAGAKYAADEILRFALSDNLSGVESYEGYIDGNWVLFTLDARTYWIEYQIDPSRITAGKEHELLIKAVDFKGNKSTYSAKFYF